MSKRNCWRRHAIAAGLTTLVVAPTQAIEYDAAFLRPRTAVSAPAGAAALCRDLPWACAASPVAMTHGKRQIATAKAVNLAVNRTVRELSDQAQYGVAERWALPTARGGDCEDLALLKKRELVARGLPPQKLLLATVLDRERNPHVVLVLRTDRGDLILDNLTDSVVRPSETGYIFLRMQDPERPGAWRALVG